MPAPIDNNSDLIQGLRAKRELLRKGKQDTASYDRMIASAESRSAAKQRTNKRSSKKRK